MFTVIFMNTAMALIWQYALIFVIQVCLLALIPPGRNRLRYGITVLVILLLLLLPFVDLAISYSHYIDVAKTAEPADSVDAQTGKEWLAISDGVNGNRPQEKYSFQKNAIQTLVYVMWASGSLIVLLITLYYQLRRYGLLSTSKEVRGDIKEVFAELVESLGISRSLRLYQNDSVNTVSMTGIYEPAVIMPGILNACDQDFIRVLFAWQLAKIKLKSNLIGYVCDVINGIFFYNPATWLVCHTVKKELRAGCLKATEQIIDTKLPDIIFQQAESNTKTVSKGFGVLFRNSADRIISAVRTIPHLASTMTKSPVNAVSILLLIALLALPSGLVLYNSGDKVLSLFSNYRKHNLLIAQKYLFIAAGSADLSTIRELLSGRPELLHSRDEDGRTLLHLAAQHPEGVHVVDYLIGKGIDVGAFDNYSRTAIHCYPGCEDTIQLLQMHGLRLDVFAAAGHGKSEDLIKMCDNEPQLIHAIDKSGRTLLDHSAQTDQLDIAKMLFEKGLKPNIYWASRLKLHETLKNIIDNQGYSFAPDPLLPYGGPLDTAVQFGYKDIISILLEAGAAPEGDLRPEDRPLRQAIRRGYSGIARILLEYGARPLINFQVVDRDTNETIICSGGDIKVSGFQYFSKRDSSEGGMLLDIPDEGIVAIKCHPDGYVPMRISWNTDHFVPATYQLALKKGGTIGGKVYDAVGNPVESARLGLEIRPNLLKHNLPCIDISTTVHSDSNGTWKSDGMPYNLDKLSVYIDHPDYFADDSYNLVTMPTSDSFRAMKAVFVVPNRIRLAGDVVDQNGHPVHNATVKLVCQGNDISCQSDRRGRYTLEEVPTAKIYLETTAEGFAQNLAMLEPTETISDYQIVMQNERTITLKAVDGHSERPLANADFGILYWKGFNTALRLKTDNRGQAVWSDAPVEDLWLSASAKGYQLNKLFINDQHDEYVIQFHKPISITGKITDAHTGLPIENFAIYAEHESIDCLTHRPQQIIYEPETFTSAEGVYSIEQRISEKSHALRIEAEGYESVTSDLFFDNSGDIEIDFELNRQQWIKGIVLGTDGTMAVGATVMLMESSMLASLINTSVIEKDEGVKVVKSDEAGNYQFSFSEEEWSLVAYNNNGYKRISHPDYEDDSTIVLEPWGCLEGHILLDNEPLNNHNVVVNPKTTEITGTLWHSYKSRTDENGKFEVNRIAPETYWIGLPGESPEGFVPEIAEIEIISGQTINLTIECIAQQTTSGS